MNKVDIKKFYIMVFTSLFTRFKDLCYFGQDDNL